ncbi:MAG: glutathione S-transferase family protein [Bacteriovoracaceae bacterium]|jgi:glutathionyl-hydroquinone reductase|nr:glutathione S-transferase family protein [Bacteriovoracaceae bacterium]
MGRLENGKWVVEEVNPRTLDGAYIRQVQNFRNTIDNSGDFLPERDRYHLYVSYACPWAHRTLIMRELKGLSDIISLSIVSPDMLENGWSFHQDMEGVLADTEFGCEYLKDVYVACFSGFSGRVTVPILLDKKPKTIVNNESSEIVRIFNQSFNGLTKNSDDFYPTVHQKEIDSVNADVYSNINNGVYLCGFARTQKAYDKAIENLYLSLGRMDQRLEGQDFLVGDQLTETDIRLYTTLVRFDLVYYFHFKCNVKKIKEFKNLHRYLKNLYEIPAFQKTTRLDHIKRHYYFSHDSINPFRIVPKGPPSIF